MPKRGDRKRKAPIGDARDLAGMAVMIASFLDHLRVKGYSARTVSTRAWDLERFLVWCEERDVRRPDEVTRPVVERYQRFLFHYRGKEGRPLSFRSQHMRLTSVCVFFQWLVRSHHLLANPASDLDMPKYPRRLPGTVLSAAEADQVLSAADISTPLGVRDRAMLEVLYSTGIRRGELAALKLFDVDERRAVVVVRSGKGGKDRVVPIGERALAWLRKYLDEVRPTLVNPQDDSTLFLTNDGHSIVLDHLTQLVGRYVEASGIDKKGSCHLFRHTMATLMLENGADVRFVQEMLGHASLDTTQIYTHVSIRKLQEIHRATHPSAKLIRGTPAGEDGQDS